MHVFIASRVERNEPSARKSLGHTTDVTTSFGLRQRKALLSLRIEFKVILSLDVKKLFTSPLSCDSVKLNAPMMARRTPQFSIAVTSESSLLGVCAT